MDASALKSKTDDSSRKFIYTTAFLAALLPEYIAPLLTLAGFVVFKRRYSLTSQKVRLGTVGKVFLAFMCYSLLSSLWSLTPLYSAAISLLWMGMLLGSFMVSNLVVKKSQLETLVTAFSLGGGAVGGIGLLQYVVLMLKGHILNPLWGFFDKIIYELMPFDITYTATVWEKSRAASTFDNPLICATYLIMILPIAVYGFISGEKKHRRLCGISAVLILGGIAGTTSRGAALAVTASLVVLLFMNSKKALSVFVTILASAGIFILGIVKRNEILEFDLEKSTDSRLKMWDACFKSISERPLIGFGAGCESTAQRMAEFGVRRPHAHSLYIEMASELGILGLLFLFVVFGFIIYDIIKLIKLGDGWGKLGIAFLAIFVGFAVISLTEFTLQTPKELQYFMLVLGMLEATKRMAIENKTEHGKERKELLKEKTPKEYTPV